MTRVSVHLAAPLRLVAGDRERVDLDAPQPTVAAALGALWAACPTLRDPVMTEQGQVRPHVNVFVGSESIRFTGGLATPLGDKAEIWILPAVSGG